MNRKAVYPGTFDPVTNGHIDIIRRASKLYDKLFVAVAESKNKKPFFSAPERLEMVRQATKEFTNVFVESFDDLVVDYVQRKNSRVVLRGLRMISDFEYEFQMALTNRKLAPLVETVFMMPNESYSYLSSKLIKEAAMLGADIASFVPKFVQKKVRGKLKNER